MTPGNTLGDWKRSCTLSTFVDSALGGSQALASFFSAPMSFVNNGNVMMSTTSQKPTTTHLVQLPAGISASFFTFMRSPSGQRWSSGPRSSMLPSGTELSTATTRASGNCAMSLTCRTRSGPGASNRHRHRCSSGTSMRCTGQPQRPGDLRHQQGRVTQPAQLSQPPAVTERPPRARRGLDRQPGLADTPGPDQRDQPGGTQRLPDQSKLGPPPDKLGQLAAQPARWPPDAMSLPCSTR